MESAYLKSRLQDASTADLRFYLRAWGRWVRAWREPLGIPSSNAIVAHMLPTVSGWSHDEDIEESISSHVLRQIDREIEALPRLERAALRFIYLHENLPAVFRSGRMSVVEANRLRACAEAQMIPRLRLRGVVLGGG